MPEPATALERQGVRLGIIPPIATQMPGVHAAWEAGAEIDELLRVAVTADRLGFDHLTCSEHVAVPPKDAKVRGAVYWDPATTFVCIAGHTRRIRLATYVLVLGYHHPLELAKRYGTLDRIASGRLVLGLGVGTLEREFDVLGAPFADRGERADDALRALRACFGRREVEYHGSHYDFVCLARPVGGPDGGLIRVPTASGGSTGTGLRSSARAPEPIEASVTRTGESPLRCTADSTLATVSRSVGPGDLGRGLDDGSDEPQLCRRSPRQPAS